jgi:hypothetical protein
VTYWSVWIENSRYCMTNHKYYCDIIMSLWFIFI